MKRFNEKTVMGTMVNVELKEKIPKVYAVG